ncbi:MAG: nicotinamide mononucleotide transporter [Bacteroidaceae bacterium]|nr:nicotinamide mononucleotide transporter [Bacteroidaceae bacterium]
MQNLLDFLAAHNLSLLDLGGTFVGLFYIYYQFRVSWKLWVASFVMSLFYITLNLQGHLYALAGIYVYYCAAAVYGLWQWRGAKGGAKSEETQAEQPVRHLPLRLLPWVLAAIGTLTLLLAAVLHLLREDQTLWADAFTSATSIVAMWLLAKKYAEHWMFWIVVDGINCALYAYLGPAYLFSSALFGFYALTCIFGYWYWLKQMKP